MSFVHSTMLDQPELLPATSVMVARMCSTHVPESASFGCQVVSCRDDHPLWCSVGVGPDAPRLQVKEEGEIASAASRRAWCSVRSTCHVGVPRTNAPSSRRGGSERGS